MVTLAEASGFALPAKVLGSGWSSEQQLSATMSEAQVATKRRLATQADPHSLAAYVWQDARYSIRIDPDKRSLWVRNVRQSDGADVETDSQAGDTALESTASVYDLNPLLPASADIQSMAIFRRGFAVYVYLSVNLAGPRAHGAQFEVYPLVFFDGPKVSDQPEFYALQAKIRERTRREVEGQRPSAGASLSPAGDHRASEQHGRWVLTAESALKTSGADIALLRDPYAAAGTSGPSLLVLGENGLGLQVFDLSDPLTPHYRAQFVLQPQSATRSAAVERPGQNLAQEPSGQHGRANPTRFVFSRMRQPFAAFSVLDTSTGEHAFYSLSQLYRERAKSAYLSRLHLNKTLIGEAWLSNLIALGQFEAVVEVLDRWVTGRETLDALLAPGLSQGGSSPLQRFVGETSWRAFLDWAHEEGLLSEEERSFYLENGMQQAWGGRKWFVVAAAVFAGIEYYAAIRDPKLVPALANAMSSALNRLEALESRLRSSRSASEPGVTITSSLRKRMHRLLPDLRRLMARNSAEDERMASRIHRKTYTSLRKLLLKVDKDKYRHLPKSQKGSQPLEEQIKSMKTLLAELERLELSERYQDFRFPDYIRRAFDHRTLHWLKRLYQQGTLPAWANPETFANAHLTQKAHLRKVRQQILDNKDLLDSMEAIDRSRTSLKAMLDQRYSKEIGYLRKAVREKGQNRPEVPGAFSAEVSDVFASYRQFKADPSEAYNIAKIEFSGIEMLSGHLDELFESRKSFDAVESLLRQVAAKQNPSQDVTPEQLTKARRVLSELAFIEEALKSPASTLDTKWQQACNLEHLLTTWKSGREELTSLLKELRLAASRAKASQQLRASYAQLEDMRSEVVDVARVFGRAESMRDDGQALLEAMKRFEDAWQKEYLNHVSQGEVSAALSRSRQSFEAALERSKKLYDDSNYQADRALVHRLFVDPDGLKDVLGGPQALDLRATLRKISDRYAKEYGAAERGGNRVGWQKSLDELEVHLEEMDGSVASIDFDSSETFEAWQQVQRLARKIARQSRDNVRVGSQTEEFARFDQRAKRVIFDQLSRLEDQSSVQKTTVSWLDRMIIEANYAYSNNGMNIEASARRISRARSDWHSLNRVERFHALWDDFWLHTASDGVVIKNGHTYKIRIRPENITRAKVGLVGDLAFDTGVRVLTANEANPDEAGWGSGKYSFVFPENVPFVGGTGPHFGIIEGIGTNTVAWMLLGPLNDAQLNAKNYKPILRAKTPVGTTVGTRDLPPTRLSVYLQDSLKDLNPVNIIRGKAMFEYLPRSIVAPFILAHYEHRFAEDMKTEEGRQRYENFKEDLASRLSLSTMGQSMLLRQTLTTPSIAVKYYIADPTADLLTRLTGQRAAVNSLIRGLVLPLTTPYGFKWSHFLLSEHNGKLRAYLEHSGAGDVLAKISPEGYTDLSSWTLSEKMRFVQAMVDLEVAAFHEAVPMPDAEDKEAVAQWYALLRWHVFGEAQAEELEQEAKEQVEFDVDASSESSKVRLAMPYEAYEQMPPEQKRSLIVKREHYEAVIEQRLAAVQRLEERFKWLPMQHMDTEGQEAASLGWQDTSLADETNALSRVDLLRELLGDAHQLSASLQRALLGLSANQEGLDAWNTLSMNLAVFEGLSFFAATAIHPRREFFASSVQAVLSKMRSKLKNLVPTQWSHVTGSTGLSEQLKTYLKSAGKAATDRLGAVSTGVGLESQKIWRSLPSPVKRVTTASGGLMRRQAVLGFVLLTGAGAMFFDQQRQEHVLNHNAVARLLQELQGLSIRLTEALIMQLSEERWLDRLGETQESLQLRAELRSHQQALDERVEALGARLVESFEQVRQYNDGRVHRWGTMYQQGGFHIAWISGGFWALSKATQRALGQRVLWPGSLKLVGSMGRGAASIDPMFAFFFQTGLTGFIIGSAADASLGGSIATYHSEFLAMHAAYTDAVFEQAIWRAWLESYPEGSANDHIIDEGTGEGTGEGTAEKPLVKDDLKKTARRVLEEDELLNRADLTEYRHYLICMSSPRGTELCKNYE